MKPLTPRPTPTFSSATAVSTAEVAASTKSVVSGAAASNAPLSTPFVGRNHWAMGMPAAQAAGALFGARPMAEAAAQIGALRFPSIITPWGRDEIVRNTSSLALSALAQRIEHPAMGLPDDLRAAFAAFAAGRDHAAVKKYEPMLRAWMTYLDRITDRDQQRLVRINTYEVPGISSIPGADRYAVRGLGMPAGPKDHVVLPDDISGELVQRHAELRKMAGLPVGKTMRLSEYEANRAEIDRDFVVQEFYRTEASSDREMYAMQEYFENKNNSMAFLEGSGVVIPRTLFAGRAGDLDPGRLALPIVFKEVRSAGGAGVTLVKNQDDLAAVLDKTSVDAEVQVQEMVPGVDCSKQYYVSEHGPAPITNTDQLIKDGVAHAGNEVLSQHMDAADNRNADRAAMALWAIGYRGYLAVDLMKPKDGSIARVIELNLRKGGVTVPTAVATQLGAGQFVSKQVILPNERAFQGLVERFALNDARKEGAMVYSVIPLESGAVKAEVVCMDRRGGREVAHAIDDYLRRAP